MFQIAAELVWKSRRAELFGNFENNADFLPAMGISTYSRRELRIIVVA